MSLSASLNPASPTRQAVARALRSVFKVETDDYLRRRFEDHRAYTATMFLVATLLGPSLWLWDRVTDPVGALGTWQFRLLYLCLGVLPMAFFHPINRKLLAWLSIGSLLIMEAVFLAILQRLDKGMTYGIGGFVIFIYSPLILLAGFSLRINIAFTLLAASVPQLLAIACAVDAFEHRHYAVLIWPTAITMIVIEFAYSHSYWRRYESERALEFSSRTDPLTGLANRRHFMPLLQAEINRSRRTLHPLSLMMIDIDHFKEVNDRFGHATGDLAICALARQCIQMTREVDTVARMGGEEFAVLMPATNLDSAKTLAERLRREVAESVTTSSQGDIVSFTISIGVAEWNEAQNPDGETLLATADARLYRAKEEGRNRVSSIRDEGTF
jgi:diguanylate cyclase (GGDEF)-like protein